MLENPTLVFVIALFVVIGIAFFNLYRSHKYPQKLCPQCGALNRHGAEYCIQCGNALD